MNNATRSILVFGIYIICAGLSLVFIPNVLTGIVGLPPTTELWSRAFGALAAVLGLYYLQAVRKRNIGFYRMTVTGRVVFASSLAAMGLLTPGYQALILFGTVDLLGAIWTGLALRQEAKVTA
jgi:hypothetical protein